jgi:diguanylate cyclase (GGDEF)-like protein
MGAASWSTVQLAEFLEVFEVLEREEMERVAIDRVAEALDAEVAALVIDDAVARCLGFPVDRIPGPLIAALPRSRDLEIDIAPLGRVSALTAPVGGRAGHLVVLRVSAPFDREEVTLLRSMGRALGLALTAAESLEATRRLAEQLGERQELTSRMFRIQRSISHRAPLQKVLDSITQGAAELLSAEVVGLRVMPLDGEAAHASLVGYAQATLDAFARLPLDQGFAGRAFVENRLVVSDRYREEPLRLGMNHRHGLEVAMAAPVHRNGETVGVINVASSAPGRRFTDAEQEILLSLAEHASLAVNDATAVHQLRKSLEGVTFQAHHDDLTGLLNRASAIQALDVALTTATEAAPVCVLFVDLDRFKLFNDMFGHAFGDLILVEVADRLRSVVRDTDYLARLSGDEFVVVAPGIDETVAARLAQRLSDRVAAPFRIDDREVDLTVSVGVAQATVPSSGEDLLADADLAMYRAKQRGRSRVVRFDHDMRSEMFRRADLERELATAIRLGELEAHFQPCVDLSSGAIVGFEALARWNHPARGQLAPDTFITVAEETGLILEIDRLILDDACARLAEWSVSQPDLTMSVNLSARQFSDDRIVADVRRTLDRHRLTGSRLWVEFTESVVISDDESTLQILRALKDLGVRFMVDDFGTGYSSLVYLKRFPVDALKIDRTFVDGLGTDREDEAIVTAIMRLAEALGHEVVAEGIENDTQRAWLERLGCRRAQGYLFSPPVDAVAVSAMLRGDSRLGVPEPAVASAGS